MSCTCTPEIDFSAPCAACVSDVAAREKAFQGARLAALELACPACGGTCFSEDGEDVCPECGGDGKAPACDHGVPFHHHCHDCEAEPVAAWTPAEMAIVARAHAAERGVR